MHLINKNRSTNYFDGARGIAVLLVWLSHTSGRNQSLTDWLSFDGIGHIGVMLFFVLSGFLLSMPITNIKNFDFLSYLTRRFLRIAPLYYIVITAVFLYQMAYGNPSYQYLYITNGTEGLLRHFLFMQGDSVFWTISAEFVFYLLLPFIVMLLLTYNYLAMISIAILSIIYCVYHLFIYTGLSDLPGLKIVSITHASQYLDVFATGVVFGYLSHKDRPKSIYLNNRLFFDLFALTIFIFTIVITLALVAKKFLIFNQPLYDFRYISFGYAFAFGFSLLSAHYGNKYLRRILEIKGFVFLGIVGYSWYLLHMPVIACINELGINDALGFFASSIVLSAVSLTSYLIIEAPFIKLGKNITQNRIQKLAA